MARKNTSPEVPTLKDLCAAYVASIQMDGRSSGTAASYANDLKVATKFFGEEATLLELTRERIREYFDSPAVTRKRDGSPKNAISIAKTRRILRLALCWAADSGWIGEAPIPVAEKDTTSEVAAARGEVPPIETAGIETTATATESDPQLPSFDHPELTRDEPTAEAPVAAPKKKGGKKAKSTAAAE